MDLKKHILSVPDFPQQGVTFRDITPLLKDPDAFNFAIGKILENIGDAEKIDYIAGIDARGFIFASAAAYGAQKGLIIARKAGKLPRETVKNKYSLEYASQTLEIHKDAVSAGQKVIIVDDVLATGGTALAAADLIENIGGKVEKIIFLIELLDLGGRKKLSKHNVSSIIQY